MVEPQGRFLALWRAPTGRLDRDIDGCGMRERWIGAALTMGARVSLAGANGED
jgi:hypothetical protein